MVKRVLVLGTLVLAIGLVVALAMSAQTGRAASLAAVEPPATLVLPPVADTYVDAEHPDQNFGPWGILRVDQSPDQRSFLRFVVADLAGAQVVKATLRVYANGSSATGYSVYAVEGEWDELSPTYNAQPAIGAELAASGPHGGARYTEVDLTSVVTGEGTYDLALLSNDDKAVSSPSREAVVNAPELVLALELPEGTVVPPASPTVDVTGSPAATDTETPTTITDTPAPSDTATLPAATATDTVVPPTATSAPGGELSLCGLSNAAWTDSGKLLRGGRPPEGMLPCLAQFGVDVIIDQRSPSEDQLGEAAAAQLAGIEYINLGIPNDTAPSPDVLQAWITTVDSRLAQGKLVLVHDAAGRGRMGLWDAVYWMMRGQTGAQAIEDRYLGKAFSFQGAKIGCGDGGNGQVQALNEISLVLTGQGYFPQQDEYGTRWANCARPGYMDGWDYAQAFTGG